MIRRFKLSDALLIRSGERAALMAEQLALNERLRYCGAVHADKRTAATLRPVMNPLREHAFSCACFSQQKNRQVCFGGAFHLLECPPHGGGYGDKFAPFFARAFSIAPGLAPFARHGFLASAALSRLN